MSFLRNIARQLQQRSVNAHPIARSEAVQPPKPPDTQSPDTQSPSTRVVTNLNMRTGYSSHSSSPLLQTSATLALFHPASWSPLTRLITVLTVLGGLAMTIFPMEWHEQPVQTQAAVATIQGGTAEVVRGDSANVERLGNGSVVNLRAGDLVSADTGGVVLNLFDGQTAVLEPGARISIEKLEQRDAATWVHLAAWSGRSTFNVPNAPGPDDLFQISSPSSATIIRGTEIAVEIVSAQETIYDVYRGVAYLRLHEQELFISPNERVRATVDQPLQLESGIGSGPALQLPINTVGAMRAHSSALPTASDPAEYWPTPLPVTKPPAIVADLLVNLPANSLDDSLSTSEAGSAASPGDTVSGDSFSGAAASDSLDINNTGVSDFGLSDRVYRVQNGDTFWGIAALHELTVEQLRSANPQLDDVSVLQIGQEILIPR